jgi:hypothetical protein
VDGCRRPALHPLHLGDDGQAEGAGAYDGGYSVQTYLTSKYVFDLRDDDVYWCTADMRLGDRALSYVVYGPLQNGATVMMYEARRIFPENDRFWKIIDDHKVTSSTPRRRRSARSSSGATSGCASTRWLAAAAGDGGRADQSRGVDVVSPRDRQGALPDRRHLVADGDGRDHDCADSGRGGDQAGFGDAAVLRDCARGGYKRRASRCRWGRAGCW